MGWAGRFTPLNSSFGAKDAERNVKNWILTKYKSVYVQETKCKVFSPSGLNFKYRDPVISVQLLMSILLSCELIKFGERISRDP